MNASEQAKSLTLTTKIATAVNLFKSQFPDAKVDLKPWRSDPDTSSMVDPDSIDIGFHLPGWSRSWQCRSILVQIRFHQDVTICESAKLIGMEIAGFSHQGQVWRLSTVEHWQLGGECLPNEDIAFKLKEFCKQVFGLFT